MTESRKVRPIEPLDAAWRSGMYPWRITTDFHNYTDTEFAAAFVPAHLYDDLLESAEAWADNCYGDDEMPAIITIATCDALVAAVRALRVALAAHDALTAETEGT